MKRIFLCAILSGGIVFVGKNEVMAQSQMNRAAYFLEGISVLHELNPAWMSEKGYVKKEDYKELCEELKDSMDEILEYLDAFDNGTYYDMF